MLRQHNIVSLGMFCTFKKSIPKSQNGFKHKKALTKINRRNSISKCNGENFTLPVINCSHCVYLCIELYRACSLYGY